MSARARRRRARAAGLPEETRAVRARRRLPLLPLVATALGATLLATAWTTRWTPGPPRAEAQSASFTLEIPPEQSRVINSWERFFICHDLTDPAVVDLTLRANQRVTGTLDFPGEKVVVALPAPAGAGEGAERPVTGAEDDLIAMRSRILGAAVPERLAAIRQQCAGGT